MGEARRRRIEEAANPLTHATPIGPYVDKAALAKSGFVELPSSTLIKTDISISELWDREKANLRRFRGRQADLRPYLDLAPRGAQARRGGGGASPPHLSLAQCEAQARRGAPRIQRPARAEKQRANAKKYAETYAPRIAEILKAYAPRAKIDKARGKRPSGRRLNNRLTGGMIVGVDCEGMNVGGHFILAYARDGTGSKIANAISAEDKPKFIDGGEAVYRRQRPCTFTMGGVEDQGYRDQILESREGLKTYQMCEWFLKTAREFASKDPKGKQPVFVGYGFNYDDAQIVADLSKKKLTAISKGKPAHTLHV